MRQCFFNQTEEILVVFLPMGRMVEDLTNQDGLYCFFKMATERCICLCALALGDGMGVAAFIKLKFADVQSFQVSHERAGQFACAFGNGINFTKERRKNGNILVVFTKVVFFEYDAFGLDVSHFNLP